MKDLETLRGKRVLIVASTGGHLAQAVKWSKRLGFAEGSLFVTFDAPQSRSLLTSANHHFVPYVAPRDYVSLSKAAYQMLRLPGLNDFDAIVSTGAGLALACLPISWTRRIPFYYIESVSRFSGPSLTGRLIQAVPAVNRYAQHEGYATSKWQLVESLLNSYRLDQGSESAEGDRPLKVLVSLGTIKPYRFDRMIDALKPALGSLDSVVWQLGVTHRQDLRGEVFDQLDADSFAFHSENADVVVTHAGVGTLMSLLDSGKKPLVMARRSAYGEHVDDHQLQVTEKLDSLGLISSFMLPINRKKLLEVANSRIVTREIL